MTNLDSLLEQAAAAHPDRDALRMDDLPKGPTGKIRKAYPRRCAAPGSHVHDR